MMKTNGLLRFALCAGLVAWTGCGNRSAEKTSAKAEAGHAEEKGHADDKKHEGHEHAKDEKKEAGHEGHAHGGGEAELVELKLDQQKANRFEFAEAVERSVGRSIQTTGVVAPNETKIARVRPLARGRVQKLNVRVGDSVRRGQALLSFDNIELGEATGEYRRTVAAVEKARAEALVTQRAMERARGLVEIGGVARGELEKREADAKNAEAAIQEQLAEQSILHEKLRRFGMEEAEIDQLGRALGNPRRASSIAVIHAPQDGVVLKVTTTEGEAIQPESQLFEIVDTSTVWVQADLYDRDLNSVRVGDTAWVMLEGYPNEKFPGKVTYIGDAVDPTSRTPKIRCEVANPGRKLKLDMYATILLPARGERMAVMVPSIAIQNLEGRMVVFVKQSDEEFQIREVKPGVVVQGFTEIESGLRAGETIAARGSFVLKSEHLKAELGEHGHSHD